MPAEHTITIYQTIITKQFINNGQLNRKKAKKLSKKKKKKRKPEKRTSTQAATTL